jgi:predicted nuclease of predicted toxin-antitoxin system
VKLFLDENIPQDDAERLLLKFPGSIYAREDNRFGGRSDREIYDFLRDKSYVLVSNDSDFSNKSI